MYSYQFIARDRAGLTLTGKETHEDTEEPMYLWTGTREQWAEADFQETFFINEGYWFAKHPGF